MAVIQSTETCLWNGDTADALALTFELPGKSFVIAEMILKYFLGN